MTKSISVAEAKRRFSELVNRAAYGNERFLIERRGRPIGAVVSADDLQRLENGAPAQSHPGLLAAVGALADFEEYDAIVQEVVREREKAMDREVDLE